MSSPVVQLYRKEWSHGLCRGQTEQLGEEPCGLPLVLRGDDRVVERDAHGTFQLATPLGQDVGHAR